MSKNYPIREVEINKIKGGICIKIMENCIEEPEEKHPTRQKISVRLPFDLLEKIERALLEEPKRISRNEFIERTLREIVENIESKPSCSVCY